MSILKNSLFTIACSVALLASALTGFAQELSLAEKKEIQMRLSYDFAANYSEEMTPLQNEMLEEHIEQSEVIMATASSMLNTRLPIWFNDKKKRANSTIEPNTIFMTMHVSMLKLGTLAQLLGLHEIAACHNKEAQELKKAALGETPTIVNCRYGVYGNSEAKSLRYYATKEGNELAALVNKWVSLNILFSTAIACTQGNCM